MKVFVVDLGSQWGHLIYRRLRDLNVDTKMVSVSSPISSIEDVDGLVFSGGALRIGKGEAETAGNCGEFLDSMIEKGTPVLGVCAGQQFIALRLGGIVQAAKTPEFGNVELTVDYANDLFEGLPEKFTVFASHNDEVVEAKGFKTLAHSKDVAIHAFKHESKSIYGTLFHPEVVHTQYGKEIYENFLKVCKR
ncbi:MAG: GMP synthase subunit A [Candidatus Norongarragalinales archaeon]